VKKHLLSTLALSLIAAFAHAAAPTSGIDLANIDHSVRPQDDFFTYQNGNWLKTTEIPADQARWGSFNQLNEAILPRLRGLIEAAAADKDRKAGSEAQKLGDLYASFMDEQRLDQLGIKPLTGELNRIRAVKDKKGLPLLVAHLRQLGVGAPYAVSVQQDAREASKYAVYVSQSGLGLPDRDYYLKQDDARMASVLAKYELHVARILGLAGDGKAAADAKAIVKLETALAGAQWSKVQNRDPVKTYNKMSIKDLAALSPAYDWGHALASAGVANKVDYVIVEQPDYLGAFGALLEQTDLATWKAYFQWQLLRAASPYLSRDYADAHFDFYGTVLTGVAVKPPRWKEAVALVEHSMGEALGKRYVAQYFPPEYKARMEQLVQNLLAAYRASIDTLDWMGPETKQQAQAKLAKFNTKIGYPDKWRDYSALAIVRGDLMGNVLRAANYRYQRMINKLGKPVDRAEWEMTPQTVNAYYESTLNEIVFPAAILQPPFFNPAADDAANYGAIGAVIGHEISHGFDDHGSQSDGDGNLRDWWTQEDRARFKAKADALTAQYDRYSPLPGYHLNGALTLGENIADNSGLAIAHKAYQLSLGGQPAPVIDGLTGDQRFYMGFAQVWREKMREAEQLRRLKIDPHAPGRFRTNGAVVNQPSFYDAFGVKPGDPMYVAPEQRVIIW